MVNSIIQDWTRYWFSDSPIRSVHHVRWAIGGFCFVWIASFWRSLPIWFGNDGVVASPVAVRMLDFEERSGWQSWSPLWAVDGLGFYYAWLAVGMLLSALVIAGIGHRWTVGVLLLWVISWAHRMVWLIGLVEPVLIAFLAYLLVYPGTQPRSQPVQNQWGTNWHAGFVLRLFQTHWWILVAAGVLMQLGNLIWWRGDAMWWLVKGNRSFLLEANVLDGRALMVNGLTHLAIIVQLLALWLLTIRSTRWLGILAGLLTSMVFGMLGDQPLYGVLLACGLCAFLPPRPDEPRYTEVAHN